LSCASNPCGHHGKCTDLYNQTAFECFCDKGWSGKLCTKEYSDSQITTPALSNKSALECGGECLNGGICEAYRCIVSLLKFSFDKK